MFETLRERCRRGVETKKSVFSWSLIQKNLSLAFVWVFIRVGLTNPNEVTFLSLWMATLGSIGIAHGVLWTGFLFYHLYFVLDCVDGDLARYFHKENDFGLFLDRMVHVVAEPLLFLSCGIACGNILYGLVPALCNQNMLRLIHWNFDVSVRKGVVHEESQKQSFPEQIARFFSIYGFTFFLLVGVDVLRVVVLLYSVWTPLACVVLVWRLHKTYKGK